MAALANIRLLGKQGYQVLIGHMVEMAEMLRERLEQHPFIQVLNERNYGPVTLFRVYPPGVDAAQAWRLDPATCGSERHLRLCSRPDLSVHPLRCLQERL